MNVIELRPEHLRKLAKIFVDTYIEHDKYKAANAIMRQVDPGEYPRMRELIREEFINRGYHFDD